MKLIPYIICITVFSLSAKEPIFLSKDCQSGLDFDNHRQVWGYVNLIGIVSSSDYGKSWNLYKSIDPLDNIVSIKHVNPGYLLGITGTNDRYIYRSESPNGPWIKVHRFANHAAWAYFGNVYFVFIDNLMGYGMTSIDLAKTTDGGYTWTECYYKESKALYRDLQFVDPEVGFFLDICLGYATQDTLVKTIDMGKTWKRLPLPETAICIRFIDRNNGLLLSYQTGNVYKTKDGGYSWEMLCSLPVLSYVHCITRRNDKEAWIRARDTNTLDNVIYHTTDGGYNWECTTITDWFFFPTFMVDTNNKVYAISQATSSYSNDGAQWDYQRTGFGMAIKAIPIIKTINDTLLITNTADFANFRYYLGNDNGFNWHERFIPDTYPAIDAFCSYKGNLWFGCDRNFTKNAIVYSTNSGNSWNTIDLPWKGNVWDISFIDDEKGILSCGSKQKPDYSRIAYTEDGGNNWTETTIPTGIQYPHWLYFFPNGTAYVLDDYDTRTGIAKSTDFGHAWSLMILPDKKIKFDDMYAVSPDTLMYAYYYLWKSTNGGTSWTKVNNDSLPYDAILFNNSLDGTAIYRKSGGIYFAFTRNGGATWREQILLPHDKYSMMRLNKGLGTTVILSGESGLLMSWDWETGFKEGGATPSSNILPNTSRLIAVYPNPVIRDKGLSVKYTLSSQADVSLKVYDLRGRLVKQVFNGSRKAGNYTLVWDLRDENKAKLTQGVYVLKLKLGSKEESKRIVVIK